MSEQPPNKPGGDDADIVSDDDLDSLLAQASLLANDLSAQVGDEAPHEELSESSAECLSAGQESAEFPEPPAGITDSDIEPPAADTATARPPENEPTSSEHSENQATEPEIGEYDSTRGRDGPADSLETHQIDEVGDVEETIEQIQELAQSVAHDVGLQDEPPSIEDAFGQIQVSAEDQGDALDPVACDEDDSHEDSTDGELGVPDFMKELMEPAKESPPDPSPPDPSPPKKLEPPPPPTAEMLQAAASELALPEAKEVDLSDEKKPAVVDAPVTPDGRHAAATSQAAAKISNPVAEEEPGPKPERFVWLRKLAVKLSPVAFTACSGIAFVLEKTDKPFGFVGDGLRYFLGILAFATLATAAVVFIVSVF